MRAFWKKGCKNKVSVLMKKANFSAILNFPEKWLTLQGCCDQTIWPTTTHRLSTERQYSYLSFGIQFLEIVPQVRLLWPLEKVASCVPPSKCSFRSWVIKLSLVKGTWVHNCVKEGYLRLEASKASTLLLRDFRASFSPTACWVV